MARQQQWPVTADYCGCCGGRDSEPPKGEHGACCAELHDRQPPRRIHVENVISEPMLAKDQTTGENVFSAVVLVDGKQVVLTMPIETANRLSHAIETGHLPEQETVAMGKYIYDPAPGAAANPDWIWVTPRQHEGAMVETQYSRGIPAGRGVNYDAAEGDPYMRTVDHTRNDLTTYYKLREDLPE